MQILRICCCVVLGILASHCKAEDWSRYGGPKGTFQLVGRQFQADHRPVVKWERSVGDGMAGIVGDRNIVITSYLAGEYQLTETAQSSTPTEVVEAFHAITGETVWRYRYEAGFRETQQVFGGRTRAPQATPLLLGKHVVTIGFTGSITCLDRGTGDVVWTKDAVADFKAVPVQFGFSASPIALEGNVLALVGGEGGLVCLDVRTGELIWNVPCKEASYATPVLWDRPDGRHVVFVTRNRVVGVQAADGRPLWDYRLPEQGLTNVPTPVPVGDTGLIVSGQGIQGTRKLEVIKQAEEFRVTEQWKSDEQFFYCNWLTRGDTLWGCVGNLLVALDTESGERLGRFRGYADSNWLAGEESVVCLDGKGSLSLLDWTDGGLQVKGSYPLMDARCWTPPTVIESRVYCRGGSQLVCLDFAGGNERGALKSQRVRNPMLLVDSARNSATADSDVEPLEQITKLFETKGREVAWNRYTEIRRQDPGLLDFDARQQLMTLARQVGLNDIAAQIKAHIKEDFPEVAKSLRPPSKEVVAGENGLKYIEFAIKNGTSSTIQAYVKGPNKHPFSYGLPLRPSRRRLERWPVGTKLYRTSNGVRRELLLEVGEDFAGQVVSVPTAKSH